MNTKQRFTNTNQALSDKALHQCQLSIIRRSFYTITHQISLGRTLLNKFHLAELYTNIIQVLSGKVWQ